MFTRLTRFALLATALLAAPIHAEDTEIYVSADLTQEVKPNILFIVDTSGSMISNKVDAVSDYDPGKTYDGECTSDKVYWSTSGLPDCTGNQWYYSDTAHNVCSKSWSALSGTAGQYSSSFGVWNTSSKSWSSLSTSNHTFMLECSADSGVHGNGGTAKYPGNSTYGPFTTNSSKKVSLTYGATLYSANYLNYRNTGGLDTGKVTRLKMVQSVLARLLGSVDNINVAVMRFRGDAQGGYFIIPMTELNDTTRLDLQLKVMEDMNDNGATPLAETMYEAGLYFRGKAAKYGAAYNVAGVMDGSKVYITPIKYQCQKNFIVLFTDGDPTSDGDADSLIQAQPGFSTLSSTPKCVFHSISWSGISGADKDCFPNMAEYLYKADVSDAFSDKQNVITYGIGFEEGMTPYATTFLNQMTNYGGGKYYGTKSASEVSDAFTSVLNNILSVNTSFTAPAVSVNAFNRLTYLDEIYYAVFRPNTMPKWDGNVKRYRLGKATGETTLSLLDATGAKAIDPNTGFFKDASKSYWSTEVDGGDVSKGGTASMFSLPRATYTCCFGSTSLTASGNKLDESTNSGNLTPALFGAVDAAERDTIVKWTRGVDVNDTDGDGDKTDARTQMGDPLHTEPLLITYGKHGDDTPDMTLYTTTNEGLLHAIDTTDGSSTFSYIPKALLGNLKTLVDNDAANPHPYGLDGPISAWVYDKNYDGVIDTSQDHVYLYLTMRRGGRNVYALNVTKRSQPEQMWVVEGGTNTANGNFTELSQTWSKATLAKVKLGGVVKNVLIFGGGYDATVQDGANTRTVDTVGRAIYMVDADTAANGGGKLLWSAGPGTWANLHLTNMTYSIPSEVRVVDIDGDNLADRMYVGDMGGRLWRIDIDSANTGASNFASGGIIADISANSSAEDTRRFYYPPSVSMSARGNYLNIAIGSGYREHPLNRTIRDRFYVFRDPNVDGPATDAGGDPKYSLLSDNLVNATTWLTSGAVDQTALANSDGYYIDLKTDGTWQGEKVLAQALTLSGYVIFTTYTPVATAMANACAPTEGMAKQYVMKIEDSTPMEGATERAVTLTHGGIPPRPVAITVPDGSAIIVGTNVGKGDVLTRNVTKSNWRRN
jgi:type IV pilus assembly protein PilY1